MKQLLLTAVFLLLVTGSPEAQIGPPELEQAAEYARRVAGALSRGPARTPFDALDVDAILSSHLGAVSWRGLSERQRERLRTFVRARFVQTLTPAPGLEAGIAWSAARAEEGRPRISLGLRFGPKTLKTRWDLVRFRSGWRIADVWLTDPGISLGRSAVRALGPEPVHPRDRIREARAEAAPRVAGLAIIGLAVFLASQRLSRPKRQLLLLTASAPALLFAIDGALAVRRALSERFALAENVPAEPWERESQLAMTAEREGHFEEARGHWASALAAGDDPAPIEYEIGLAYRDRGESSLAEASFRRALQETLPAPGAARELAAIAAAASRLTESDAYLARYFLLAGPDPEALSLAAAIRTRLGKTDEALDAIREARAMVGGGWRGAELEARIHALAQDASAAVSVLRPLAAAGRLDRAVLRANPDYLLIANDPAWVEFLNEIPPAR